MRHSEGVGVVLMKSFGEIVKLIEDARNNALRKVNEELITLYWKVGQYVSQKSASAEWGEMSCYLSISI